MNKNEVPSARPAHRTPLDRLRGGRRSTAYRCAPSSRYAGWADPKFYFTAKIKDTALGWPTAAACSTASPHWCGPPPGGAPDQLLRVPGTRALTIFSRRGLHVLDADLPFDRAVNAGAATGDAVNEFRPQRSRCRTEWKHCGFNRYGRWKRLGFVANAERSRVHDYDSGQHRLITTGCLLRSKGRSCGRRPLKYARLDQQLLLALFKIMEGSSPVSG